MQTVLRLDNEKNNAGQKIDTRAHKMLKVDTIM